MLSATQPSSMTTHGRCQPTVRHVCLLMAYTITFVCHHHLYMLPFRRFFFFCRAKNDYFLSLCMQKRSKRRRRKEEKEFSIYPWQSRQTHISCANCNVGSCAPQFPVCSFVCFSAAEMSFFIRLRMCKWRSKCRFAYSGWKERATSSTPYSGQKGIKERNEEKKIFFFEDHLRPQLGNRSECRISNQIHALTHSNSQFAIRNLLIQTHHTQRTHM